MGCGGSKSNPDHNAVPARLRPVLWRRLEEIRARIAGGGGGGGDGALIRTDPSKKQPLIIEGSSDTVNQYYENNVDPTNPSCHQTQYCPPTLQKIVDDPTTTSCTLLLDNKCDDHEEIKGLVIEEGINLCKDNRMDLDNYDGKVTKEIEKAKGLDEMEENEEVNEHEMVGGACGASPSFKVYCRTDIDSISNLYDEEEYDEYAEAENVVDCQGIGTSDESVSSNEVSVKHLPKKGTRGNRFKKMIPKGGKNMFTLHNLPCSSNNSHDNSHLLQKAAA